MLKVKNFMKSTPSKLYHIRQTSAMEISAKTFKDFEFSTVFFFCKKLHFRSLAGFLIHTLKPQLENIAMYIQVKTKEG